MTRQALRINWLSWLPILALAIFLAACSSPEERARAHNESGHELLRQGEFLKAGLEFRNALKFNDKLAGAWDGLATVEEQRQNWPAVSDSLQRVIELEPSNFDARVKLAKLQLAAIQLDKALKNVNEANELRKNDTNVLALRAAILFRLNDKDGARKDAELALSVNPDNPDAHAVLAADQMAVKNYPAALRFIERGLKNDANNLGLLMFKIKIYEDTQDDPKLEAVLRQIIAAYPKVKELRQALLAFLANRKRGTEVEAEMRAMLAEDPTDTALGLDLVSFLRAVKGQAIARKELEGLVTSNPSNAAYQFAMAQVDFSEKQSDAAVARLEKYVAENPEKPDAVRAKLMLSTMNLQLGQRDKAKTIIDEILSRDAKNAEALGLRANLSLDAGQTDSAVADLREALNQQPNSVPLLMLLGRAHERQGAVDLANDRMAQAVKASNSAPQIVLDYVAFLERRNRIDDVGAALDAAVTQNPNSVPLLQALARFRLNRQDWVGAQSIAESLKKLGDQSGASQQIVGAAQFGQKKYDDSIETLKNAYSATPDAVQPMYSLYLAYVQSGKIPEAENFLKSILTASPDNADALVLMGSLKAMQKQPKEAESAYKQAIERQPAKPVGYISLAKHYLSQNQITEAEKVLKAAREKAPVDLGVNLLLAGLLETNGNIEGAIAIYEEQIKSTPDALIVINNLSSLLADHRTDPENLERAYQLTQRLVAIDSPYFKDTVGWVAYRRGDNRTALLNLEQAAEKLPTLALVKYHLAMTYVALKRTADARAQFAKTGALLKPNDPLQEKIRLAVASLDASN
jgi:tetratricopeptide (TPR) repeat protein